MATQARTPLEGMVTETNTKLLKEAQDSIFGAQKDAVDYADASKADQLRYVEEKAAALKSIALQPTFVKSELSHAIDELRNARARLQDDSVSSSSMSDAEKEQKLRELEVQNQMAAKAKAELLGLGVPPAAADAVIYVTHTATAVEMTTHVEWVYQTVAPDAN